MACIERPDFATEQPGQPDFNFTDLTSATQFPAYVTGTLEGLGPVVDVLVLEIHFRRRARRIAIYSVTRPRRKRIRNAKFFRIRETMTSLFFRAGEIYDKICGDKSNRISRCFFFLNCFLLLFLSRCA